MDKESEKDITIKELRNLLFGYEELEANLITDHSDNLLEVMSSKNYNLMMELQKKRNKVLRGE
jgi:hypothetical protein